MTKKKILIPILAIIIFYNIGYADVNYIKNVEASSSIKGYPAKYAIDGKVDTTWACKNIEHQWIKMNFKKKVKLYGIYIASGYLKNKRAYKNNNRLKIIKILHNNQEIVLDDFKEYSLSLEDYVKLHVDDYKMQFMGEGFEEYECIKKAYKNHLKYIDKKVSSLFYPVIFKNPIKCNNIKVIICDTYVSDKYNEICISEIYPIIEDGKYSNPNLNELRDIGFIFEKLQDNDKGILLSGSDTTKNDYSDKYSDIKGMEYFVKRKSTLQKVDLDKLSINKNQPVRYVIDSKHKYLVLWNGKSKYLENGISHFPILFFKKINNNWKFLAVEDMYLYTIYDIMPHFRNKLSEDLLSVFKRMEDY